MFYTETVNITWNHVWARCKSIDKRDLTVVISMKDDRHAFKKICLILWSYGYILTKFQSRWGCIPTSYMMLLFKLSSSSRLLFITGNVGKLKFDLQRYHIRKDDDKLQNPVFPPKRFKSIRTNSQASNMIMQKSPKSPDLCKKVIQFRADPRFS